MTMLRNFAGHFVAAASALALSFVLISGTVTTPSAHAPAPTTGIYA